MEVFENFGLSHNLITAIRGLGFSEPTQIQRMSIPPIMEGRDVIGESATGSGKTLAFGCGIIDHVVPNQGLQAVILTPTRELAEQVKESLREFARHKHLKIISVYGGVSINPQIEELAKCEVVVATPGRFLDHLGRRTIDTSKVKLLVLDEADRMFDMGFIEDVEEIIRACPRKRQTLFFSATISDRIKNLARKYMVNPKTVLATKMVDPSKLRQVYYDITKGMKMSLLVHLLRNEKAELVMVFCNTRRNSDFVAKNLKANRINAIVIHGGLSQNKRTRTINLFNDGKVNVLVCTDVAARGLDIDNVSHIYNYDLPGDPTDYVHRIGRTARAGEEGKVINLLCNFDYDNFSRIQSEYRDFKIEKAERPYLERAVFVRDDIRRGDRGRRFAPNRGRRRWN
ncbi:DEAD/DEAH box helicase [Candidatus Woesearchaeota archaeon]|nr:DEAD/DEAH box helicase [Candidatus Woesearchaeota archaeon]